MKSHKLAPHEWPLLDDTSAEARQALARVYQQMTPERKAAVAGDLGRMTRQLFEAGYRARHPDATGDDVVLAWMRHTLEPELYEKARSVRDEYRRRRLERSAQSGSSVGENAAALCAGGITGQLGAGCAAGDE